MAKSSKKLKIGYVQDTPVSTSMISNECMICHMKVHIVSYNLDQKNFSKSKIHILPNYEQKNLKTTIVYLLSNSSKRQIMWEIVSNFVSFLEIWTSPFSHCYLPGRIVLETGILLGEFWFWSSQEQHSRQLPAGGFWLDFLVPH